MTGKELVHKVRMSPEVNDANAARYSDYQILDALNTVLNHVYVALGTFSNDLLTKCETVELTNGVGELPEDFMQVVEVYHNDIAYMPRTKGEQVSPYTYAIYGNEIHASSVSSLTIDYKPVWEDVTLDTWEDDLPLPLYFRELLRRYIVAALKGSAESDELAGLRYEVRALTANRGKTRLEMKGVWSEEV